MGVPFSHRLNVGIFAQARNPALVPDMFLSLDVELAADRWRKKHRSYFLWEFGKQPELDVHFISSLPVGSQPACMAWEDRKRAQSVEGGG
jgi:hypothetical protein